MEKGVEVGGIAAPGSFAELGIAPYFIEALAGRGILSPTPVQALVCPRLLAGESLFFSSATGTGKTFAYLIPIFQCLLASAPSPRQADGPRVLIAAPTYELCSQIKTEVDFLLEPANAVRCGPENAGALPSSAAGPLKAALLIGGGNIGRQIDGLRKEKPDIVIGNPGRILQIARLGKLKSGNLEYLVLDEGDRLVSPDLAEETGEFLRFVRAARPGAEKKPPLGVCRALRVKSPKIADQAIFYPANSQSTPDNRDFCGTGGAKIHKCDRLLVTACSATLSGKTRDRILDLLDAERTDFPLLESHDRAILGERIQHWAIFSERRKKIDTLRSFFTAAKPRKTLVFTAGAGEVGNILSRLQYHHIAASALFGGMDKGARKQALDDFRKNRVTVLVSSDLAARGLDIDGISHIIALDVPQSGDAYIHRAGRTGRMGKAGIMLTIGDAEEMRALARLEKKLGIVIYPKELRGGKVTAPQVPTGRS